MNLFYLVGAVYLLLAAVCVTVMVVACRRATFGWEDEHGFHEGER